jgi:hypothetical protein
MPKKDDRPERPNREKQKVGGRGFKEFPKSGRKRCRVLNLASPGDQVEAAVNGVNFIIQHDSIVDLHPSQIYALQKARIHTTEYVEDPAVPGKFTTRPITIPRVMVDVMGDAPDPKRKKAGDGQPQVPPAEEIPTNAAAQGGDPRMISGRG